MFPLGGTTKIGKAIERNRIERLNATITNIYTTAYQQDADATLIANRNKATATLDDPFTAVNPYGTNTTSMYVYFTTSEAASVSYTVHAEGYPDFTATANQGKNYATTHEFIVLGLIPRTTNTITLKLTDARRLHRGDRADHLQRPEAPRRRGNPARTETNAHFAAAQSVGNGLYAILGNDSNDQDFMYYYDVNGVIRGEIPVKYYRSHRLLFDDNGLMWFSASTHTWSA